jgi:very-short-patch-repair endonuclease
LKIRDEDMFIETQQQEHLNKRWHNIVLVNIDVFSCDECNVIYQKYHKAKHSNKNILTFCSPLCLKNSRSFGKLADKRKMTCKQRYGVEFASQIDNSTEKMLSTRFERYGTIAPIHDNVEISKKWHQTSLEKYGTYWPGQNEDVKLKKEKTYQKKYGVKNPLATGSPFRTIDNCVKGGQVGYRSLVCKLGDKFLSKPEALALYFFREYFGHEDVEQQVLLDHGGKKSWMIDFYIKSIKTYIEIDGVFWHGLDKPYDQLHPHKQKKYDLDRAEDAWFNLQGLKLVRFTDKEFLACQKTQNFSDIVNKLGG